MPFVKQTSHSITLDVILLVDIWIDDIVLPQWNIYGEEIYVDILKINLFVDNDSAGLKLL